MRIFRLVFQKNKCIDTVNTRLKESSMACVRWDRHLPILILEEKLKRSRKLFVYLANGMNLGKTQYSAHLSEARLFESTVDDGTAQFGGAYYPMLVPARSRVARNKQFCSLFPL